MEVIKLEECGYKWAALGFSLSYKSTIERTMQILPKYAFSKPGEAKFLESIYLWLDVTAPRFFWQEADTYIFATNTDTNRDFWVQIGVDWKARRMMSAKVIPNL